MFIHGDSHGFLLPTVHYDLRHAALVVLSVHAGEVKYFTYPYGP